MLDSSSSREYKPVSPSDHDHDHDPTTHASRSSTDVSERKWHTGREQDELHEVSLLDGGDGRRRSKSSNLSGSTSSLKHRLVVAFRRYRWLVDTFLLLFNIALSLLLVRDLWAPSGAGAKDRARSQVGGDYTGAGPIFTTQITKFKHDADYVPADPSQFLSEDTMAVWSQQMPMQSGKLELGQTYFTTTMTHQLHCLYMMGRTYSALVANDTAALRPDSHSRFLGCLDYLRQGVMCAGDMALEPHYGTGTEDGGEGDGMWNGHHVCKDYGQMVSYLEMQIMDGARWVLPIED